MLPNRRPSYSPPSSYVPARRSPLRNVSAIDSPLIGSSEFAPAEKDEQHPSHHDFFSQMIPEPTSPRSTQRAIASVVLFLFIVCIVWTAAVEPDYNADAVDYAKGLAWTGAGYVVEQAQQAHRDKQYTWPSPSEGASTSEMPTFDEVRAAEVEAKVTDGSLNAYIWHNALSDFNQTRDGRLIVLGDLHGMNASLAEMLERLALDEKDMLLHVGDLVSKSPVKNSLSTVALMRKLGARGARGNHDHGVIQWREWMLAYGTLDSSKPFSESPVQNGGEATDVSDVSEETDDNVDDGRIRKRADGWSGQPPVPERPSVSSEASSATDTGSDGSLIGSEWSWLDLPAESLPEIGVKVPKGWEWQGAWFEIARRLSSADYNYLKALPLTLRIHQLRTYIVHAGLVPWAHPVTSSTTALAPTASLLSSKSLTSFVADSSDDLTAPLLSLVTEEANTDPSTLLTMRTLSGKGDKVKVSSKGKKGTPWYERWNAEMAHAAKNDHDVQVVYGHWAGKGLTLRDHSVGLDSGCVYGKALSALVIPYNQDDPVSPLSTTASAFRKLVPGWSSPMLPTEDEFQPPAMIDAETTVHQVPRAGDIDDRFVEETLTFAGRKAFVVSMKCDKFAA